MRILMTTDPIGGVWTFTRELACQLLGNGCSVALVSLGRIPTSAQLDWVAAQVSRWGPRFRFSACDTPLEWMQDNQRAYCEAEPLLLRVAEESNAEAIVSSQFCFGALRCDLPRVVVAHGDVLSRARVCQAEPLPPSAWLQRYLRLTGEGLRRADAVVAPTQWMLDALAENFQLPAVARVIMNGRTLPPPYGSAERHMQAVTAGPLWDEGKNLKILAAVDAPMPLLVAGEIEHEGRRLQSSCGQAVLLGPLDAEEMLALFRQSSIYVCTSQYEPFGLAPLEAALCGCAVLVNHIPSLREVWRDAALYFDSADSLSALLRSLSGGGKLLAHARARAQERALELSARRMAGGYMEILQAILQPSMAEHYAA